MLTKIAQLLPQLDKNSVEKYRKVAFTVCFVYYICYLILFVTTVCKLIFGDNFPEKYMTIVGYFLISHGFVKIIGYVIYMHITFETISKTQIKIHMKTCCKCVIKGIIWLAIKKYQQQTIFTFFVYLYLIL